MTNQHLITPPPKLVQQWDSECELDVDVAEHLATQAAQWGADQQLAKDAKWLDQHALDAPHLKITPVGKSLIKAMRPKPPSLKEQALEILEINNDVDSQLSAVHYNIIRRALEALPQ